ncbi:methyltransferase-like protein 27 [Limulus polyphemus]|uniref:Methyltransferase-like protein 27 n=1 Tax=Limulus polyphemus TaxID=6850 RepID=A0ABM1T726_LIMPO|nr:methyltransferase-like protein 27 [Limulus polyphemus]
MTTTSESSNPTHEKVNFIESVLQERPPEETCEKFYQKWAATYDEDMIDTEMYGPKTVVEEFVELGLGKNVRILDVGAGTGCVASLLQKHGYTNIDALDGSIDMLEVAKSRDLYRNYIVDIVSEERKTTIKDGK